MAPRGDSSDPPAASCPRYTHSFPRAVAVVAHTVRAASLRIRTLDRQDHQSLPAMECHRRTWRCETVYDRYLHSARPIQALSPDGGEKEQKSSALSTIRIERGKEEIDVVCGPSSSG